MNIKDIRIGNTLSRDGEIFTVMHIPRDGQVSADPIEIRECGSLGHDGPIDDWRPVVLTEEIIRRYNLVKHNISVKPVQDVYTVYVADMPLVNINYLHQLENVCYALTHVELNTLVHPKQ